MADSQKINRGDGVSIKHGERGGWIVCSQTSPMMRGEEAAFSNRVDLLAYLRPLFERSEEGFVEEK